MKIFLDSGAFSVYTGKVKIDIDNYISFIKKYEDYLDVYANLDVIGDPEASYSNQKYMESKGLTPLPCFHQGSDEKYLRQYLDEGHTYIALGGLVGAGVGIHLSKGLDRLFLYYFTDKEGKAKIKVHGFGITSLRLLFRYPWYSVDSSTWVKSAGFGQIYMPRYDCKLDRFAFDERSRILWVSKEAKEFVGRKHYFDYSQVERVMFDKYFDLIGTSIEDLLISHSARRLANIRFFDLVEKNMSTCIFDRRKAQLGFFSR
jgi:hypothetical protein